MKDLDKKQSVLDEIIELMGEREGGALKGLAEKKKPVVAVTEVEIEKPEAVESSDELAKKDDDSEITPEQLQKLLEHFRDLK